MIEELFMKLVTIDSPSGKEAAMGRFVKNELELLGFSCKTDKEGNLVGFNNAKGEPCLISAHLDTVQGKTSIKPKRVNGHFESSGDTILGADNKATVAAILTSLRNVPAKKRRNIEVVFSVREETDGGVSKMDTSFLKSKKGISADAGEPIGYIVTDTPFIEGFTVEVRGKKSHSSEPEYGINALSITSLAISKFPWGKVDAISTANIGLIRGGSAVNVTPGKVFLEGELRSYDKKNLDKVKTLLEKVFRESARVFNGQVSFNFRRYCVGYSMGKQDTEIKFISNIHKKLGIRNSYKKSFGGSDANFFNSKGIRVVDIGDGVRNPHTSREVITVEDLNRLANIFSEFIMV